MGHYFSWTSARRSRDFPFGSVILFVRCVKVSGYRHNETAISLCTYCYVRQQESQNYTFAYRHLLVIGEQFTGIKCGRCHDSITVYANAERCQLCSLAHVDFISTNARTGARLSNYSDPIIIRVDFEHTRSSDTPLQ